MGQEKSPDPDSKAWEGGAGRIQWGIGAGLLDCDRRAGGHGKWVFAWQPEQIEIILNLIGVTQFTGKVGVFGRVLPAQTAPFFLQVRKSYLIENKKERDIRPALFGLRPTR